MGLKSSDVVRFDFGPFFKVKQGQSNLNLLITPLLLVIEVCNVKPTNRKSRAVNLLMWSHLALGPLVQGQMSIGIHESVYNSLIIGPRGFQLMENHGLGIF